MDVTWPLTKGTELSPKTISDEDYTDQNIAFITTFRKNSVVGYQLWDTVSGSGPLAKLKSSSNERVFP